MFSLCPVVPMYVPMDSSAAAEASYDRGFSLSSYTSCTYFCCSVVFCSVFCLACVLFRCVRLRTK